jgi:hypothetical protein
VAYQKKPNDAKDEHRKKQADLKKFIFDRRISVDAIGIQHGRIGEKYGPNPEKHPDQRERNVKEHEIVANVPNEAPDFFRWIYTGIYLLFIRLIFNIGHVLRLNIATRSLVALLHPNSR